MAKINWDKVNRIILKLCELFSLIPAFSRRYRVLILAVFVGLTVFLALGLPKIKLDQSMDAFFEADAPVLTNYQIFKKVFGSDEVQVILYEPEDPEKDIFHPDVLKAINDLETEINQLRVRDDSALNRITRVRSIISANVLVNADDALMSRPFIGDRLPQTLAESNALRERAFLEKDFPGHFFSKNGRIGMLILNTDYGAKEVFDKDQPESAAPSTKTAEETDAFDFGGEETAAVIAFKNRKPGKLERQDMKGYHPFIVALETLLLKHGFTLDKQITEASAKAEKNAKMHVTLNGNPWIMEFFMKLITDELGLYLIGCFGLILLTLLLAFGSLSAVVWPFLIIAFSIMSTLGFIGWVGLEVTMMINIVAFLIVTIGVATSIHIFSGFFQKMREGADRQDALQHAYYHSGLSISFANLTTIVGMLSLTIVPIVPIRYFGWFATIGVAFCFLATTFLLPTLLSFWSPKPAALQKKSLRTRYNTFLREKLVHFAMLGVTYRKQVMLIFGLFSLLIVAGLPKVVINTNFVEMIRPGNGMREAYEIIDRHFGGTSNLEVVVDTGKQNGLHDPKVLNAIDTFIQKVSNAYPEFVRRTDSIVKLAKDAHQKMTTGQESDYRIADTLDVSAQVLSLFESADAETRALFVDDNWQVARLTIISISKGTMAYKAFSKDVRRWGEEILGPLRSQYPGLDMTITGGIPMAMELVDFVATSQFRSFFVALAAICLVLILIYGSVRFGILALIPNLFPILLILGYAGWMGIPFDSDTLLVIPIAIGVVVDDTIHFLTHFRTRLLEGATRREAIENTAREVGQAMSLTSVVLTLGFCVFLFSIYIPFNNFGLLSALGIGSAFFADIVLLPALLMTFNVFGVNDEK